MTAITGRCLCGATTFVAEGPAKFSLICHCRECQKATGTGGAPQLAVARAGMRFDGPLRTYEAVSDRGNALGFGFCSACGSPICKTTAMAPDLMFLYAGALDDAAAFRDPRVVFEESRPAWDRR